ncbi:MAG: hypothetical protein R3F59_11890 [Myxococcota bacterium]
MDLRTGARPGPVGCAGKVRRAERWVDAAAEDPRAETIAEAVARADDAAARSPTTPPRRPSAAGPTPWRRARSRARRRSSSFEAAADALSRAIADGAAGGVHAELSEVVLDLEALALAGLVNDVEARDWALASRRLAPRSPCATPRTLRGENRELEAKLQRLAVQVSAETGHPAAARDHYQAWVAAAERQDPLLASLVARTLADAGDADAAIAFVAPLSAAAPDDEALMRTEVEIRTASGDAAGAVERIERARPHLMASVSGAFLAAGLYDAVGEPERARAAYQRVIELEPSHVDARVALGRSYTALAVATRGELAERGEELEAPRPSREVLELVRTLREAWGAAEENLLAAVQLDAQSRPAARALVELYEARIDGIDPETASRAERKVLAAYEDKLRAAREALAALEPT